MNHPAHDNAATASAEGQLAFDSLRLEEYLRPHIGGLRGPLRIEKFSGGQSNPTYRIVTADADRYVLRKRPAGELLSSAHAVDREFRVTQSLQRTGFPVARPLLYCGDESVIGTAFYVMDFIDGRVLRDQTLPGLSRQDRAAVWDELNRLIAGLHAIDYQAVGLADYGKTGNYLARQVNRWTKQYRATETGRIEAMDRLIEWLPENIPAGDETSIVHGDFRLENLILHPTEPRAIAVLDWELSTLGHPLADLAYFALSWHLPPDLFGGLKGLDVQSLGIPTEREFLDAYCRRTARSDIDAATWNYCIAYNLFRVAAIAQGITKRALDGNASNTKAMEVGRTARPVAELAWALVQEINRNKRA